jgi:hypothetical protein
MGGGTLGPLIFKLASYLIAYSFVFSRVWTTGSAVVQWYILTHQAFASIEKHAAQFY